MQAQRSYDMAGKSIFIALPAYDFKVSLKLAISLARFAQSAAQHGVDIQIGSICGCSVVSRARNLLAQDMLDSQCDFLLFIDSDINFEPEDIFRLMAWGQDPKKGIVAAVPRTRSETKTYIANLDYDDNGELTMNGMGLVRAERVATAFMLVRREVFVTLSEAHPEWSYYDRKSDRMLSCMFDFQLAEEGYIGEDYLFCDRAREHGFEVWIDPSITLGHMGVQEYVGNYGRDVLYPMVVPMQKDVA
jgi:cellulose synthase/poly-beta-1,6-N-acetylglucosamine synthase-like glycosyltransferase